MIIINMVHEWQSVWHPWKQTDFVLCNCDKLGGGCCCRAHKEAFNLPTHPVSAFIEDKSKHQYQNSVMYDVFKGNWQR